MSHTPDMEAARLLQAVSPLPVPPFLLNEQVYDELAETSAGGLRNVPALPSWTFAKKCKSGSQMPQTIAHRGYKAKYPENTMGAFKGAIEIGTHAIETDVRLTKDGVVALSHDATLKRCFGRDQKIIDLDWDDIKDLETLKTPHQKLPRLLDLLTLLAAPGSEDVWLLLDIKIDNDANTDDFIRLIAETIHAAPPCHQRPWNQRVVLGCWAAKYLSPCAQYLPDFSITHIGFSTTYARQFFRTPNVSFNMLQQTLLVPYFGRHFLRDVQNKGRPLYTWTVNEEAKMRWCIREGLDGVITDDPKKFLEVCADWEQGHRKVDIPWRQWLITAWMQLMICIFSAIFWYRHGGMDRSQKTGLMADSDREHEQTRTNSTDYRRPMKQ